MRRFRLAMIVAMLTFSASGIPALVVAEPCSGSEQPGREHGGCPPTCVTCGCCAQAAEAELPSIAVSPDAPVAEVEAIVPHAPTPRALDILHVPRLRLL